MQPSVQKEIKAPRADEYKEVAWGVLKDGEKVSPFFINRAKVGDMDVKIKMMFCGICHTDVHFGKNDMHITPFPCVAGHELAGVVQEVGAKVTKVKVGDNVGVGCMVDSCLNCPSCKKGEEQYCDGGMTGTYGAKKTHGRVGGDPDMHTHGGYSGSHVCHEHFVCKIPDSIPLEKAGPLLCAGITMWDPLRHWGATKGDRKMTIGVVGVGGLGTMGIKLAKALGHRVVAISRSKDKTQIALQKGADVLVASSDPESIQSEAGKVDLILNTVSANHDVNTYIPLLAKDGSIVQLGAVFAPHTMSQVPFMMKRISFTGSAIGGIKSTEEMLEFCGKNGITPDTETIDASKIQWAWDKLFQSNDSGVRYVIDIQASLKNPQFLPK